MSRGQRHLEVVGQTEPVRDADEPSLETCRQAYAKWLYAYSFDTTGEEGAALTMALKAVHRAAMELDTPEARADWSGR